MVNESTDSFQVTCTPGFNGGLPQHFTLEVYKEVEMKRVLAANMSSTIPSFTVSGKAIMIESIFSPQISSVIFFPLQALILDPSTSAR